MKSVPTNLPFPLLYGSVDLTLTSELISNLISYKPPKDLLDPLTNVRVAAQILSEQIARHPHDAALAIGNYHSSRPDRARWYARHVLRLYTNLKTQRR